MLSRRRRRKHYLLCELIKSGHDYLTEDDIYYVHGNRNSSDDKTNEDFLDECTRVKMVFYFLKPCKRGSMIQFIDSVYLLSIKSISHLMQTAGRALRYHEDKNHAAVIQVCSNQLEYFFEKRWLYQDISDRYRPQLIDIEYNDPNKLVAEVEKALKESCLNIRNHTEVIEQLADLKQEKDFRLFLIGLPYSGKSEDFASNNQYRAILLNSDDEERFVENFNRVYETTI